MENFESFSTSDRKEGLSPEAYEAFQEKMKKAAKEMSAAKKKEKKQKKKEEDLYKILLSFIKNSKNNRLVKLLTNTLERNMPSGFLLSIIQLGNKEITDILGVKPENDNQITFFVEENDLSPIMKLELDLWVKNQLSYSEESYEKILKKCLISENGVLLPHETLLELHEYVILEYLRSHSVNIGEQRSKEFSQFILNGILSKYAPKELNSTEAYH